MMIVNKKKGERKNVEGNCSRYARNTESFLFEVAEALTIKEGKLKVKYQ